MRRAAAQMRGAPPQQVRPEGRPERRQRQPVESANFQRAPQRSRRRKRKKRHVAGVVEQTSGRRFGRKRRATIPSL
jgi:hypothetical protein